MECSIRKGIVQSVSSFPGLQELTVELPEGNAVAINYPDLTGPCQPGDEVMLNTTAEELCLGTGGFHYVLAICGRERSLSKLGHIIKLRYTPLQGRVLSVEEEGSPYHHLLAAADSLDGLPVAVGSLHSMLAPLSWAVWKLRPGTRLVYLMSDGAALPIVFSRTVRRLKEMGLITAAITFGHAFGGDFEAVNVYSALLAAKLVVKADLAVIAMGPGVVGTGTRWGTTAIEQGIFLNAVRHIDGVPVAIPRLSDGDQRQRHFGLSHHTRTVLTRVVDGSVVLSLPRCYERHLQAEDELVLKRHQVFWEETDELFSGLGRSGLPLSTMGRGVEEDPLFFHGVLAAARTLVAQLN